MHQIANFETCIVEKFGVLVFSQGYVLFCFVHPLFLGNLFKCSQLKLTHLWLRIHTVFGQGYDEDPVTWQTRGDVFQDSGEADAELKITTPQKINMEHSRGGLEDHFLSKMGDLWVVCVYVPGFFSPITQ